MRGFDGLMLMVLVVGTIVRFWWVIAAALGAVVLFVGLLWLAFYAAPCRRTA
jgi:hypothetical protein